MNNKKWSLLDNDSEFNEEHNESTPEPDQALNPEDKDVGDENLMKIKPVPLYSRLSLERQKEVFQEVNKDQTRFRVNCSCN